jgi:peptide/nickel transport system permease protein
MSTVPLSPPAAKIRPTGAPAAVVQATRGFWADVWRRFARKRLSVLALVYVILMACAAILSPAIAGTKPILVRYKGHLSSPALGYFNERWESPQLVARELRKRYSPERLTKNDAHSWALWPLVFQDPYRRIREKEWPGQPENPSGSEGRPSRFNLLGTNQAGVDVFAQLVHGTRVALLVGFVATGISAIIGITLGALAGYFGGWIDMLLSRIIELVMCVPTLVLILALLAVVDKATIWHTMAVLGILGWTGIARLTRAEFLKLRTIDFVTAARALGAGWPRIVFRHILPNAMAPILVPITFGIASAILIENALSFLGFGAPPPNASWGTLLSAGQRSPDMWWLIIFPGTAIFLTVLAYNLIGEGLQEATDPRLRESAK